MTVHRLSIRFALTALILASVSTVFGQTARRGQRVIVGLGTGPAQARGLARLSGLPKRSLAGGAVVVAELPSGTAPDAFCRSLRASGDYRWAVPDALLKPARISNDPLLRSQWQHNTIQTISAWDILTGSKEGDPEMKIAICDSGVSAVPDLAAALEPGYHSPSHRTQAQGGPVSDVSGHGTEVAGAAAAVGDNGTGVAGVGWNFKILPVRVTDFGDGAALASDILDGVQWAAEHGAKVVNVSYAGVENPAVEAVGEYIRTNYASILVWSAGNQSSQINTDPPAVVVVGATD